MHYICQKIVGMVRATSGLLCNTNRLLQGLHGGAVIVSSFCWQVLIMLNWNCIRSSLVKLAQSITNKIAISLTIAINHCKHLQTMFLIHYKL